VGLSEFSAIDRLNLSRILHTVGSAIRKLSDLEGRGGNVRKLLESVYGKLDRTEKSRLAALGLPAAAARTPRAWAAAAQDAAFENISRTIVYGGRGPGFYPGVQLRREGSSLGNRDKPPDRPKNALRSDEIIWGRAPARLDLGGGWTDTPPYSLENGGCVINAAVNLNGQPPIQVYARVIPEPEIRIYSIDHGAHLTIRTMAELLDYRLPTSKFGLAKATLALCGFGPAGRAGGRRAPSAGDGGHKVAGVTSLRETLRAFGGGIELSTLAAIPSGSGLGTSSIMGAALMAVVHRMIGRAVTPRDLFHYVLQLEQELTTGGGWQDQVGGVLPGVKMIRTEPGLVPDPRIHYVTADVLDPRGNLWEGRGYAGPGAGRAAGERERETGGQTLLYYTGIRRLAKNILRTVVGNYLDRDAAAMDTLRELHAYPPKMSEAMAGKDMRRFGELIDLAWRLNKRIDPDSTTPVIEGILGRIEKHIWGAKLLGAGGGGFLLIVARSPRDARAVRRLLEQKPPNARARFFDYEISHEGLNVTVC
jgi:galactokinase/mevalonate kinase-like predicted kinase